MTQPGIAKASLKSARMSATALPAVPSPSRRSPSPSRRPEGRQSPLRVPKRREPKVFQEPYWMQVRPFPATCVVC